MKCLLLLLTALLVNCASSGGIGVVFNQQGYVRTVFSDSPAERAGIIVNDRILNTRQLRGKIGTICLVKLFRQDDYFELSIRRVDVKTFNKW